jgi:hypothetical protein
MRRSYSTIPADLRSTYSCTRSPTYSLSADDDAQPPLTNSSPLSNSVRKAVGSRSNSSRAAAVVGGII